MAIIDIDDLLKEEEEQGFKVKGKIYTIPDLSHKSLLKLEQLRQKIIKAVGEKAYEEILNLNIETICVAVPGLTPDFVRENFPSRMQQQILRVINASQMDEVGQAAVDEELAYYRKKHKDAFRKKEVAGEGK